MKFLKNEHGISLVEVIIASGISVAVAIGFMGVTDNQTKALKNIEARYDILENVNSIKKLLANSENCTESFKNLNPNSSPNLSDLIQKNLVTNTLDPVFPVDEIFGLARVKISNYNLSRNPTNTNEMFLNIDYHFLGGNMKELTRRIKLYVYPNNSSPIASCGFAGSEIPVITNGPIVELHHVHGPPANNFRATKVVASCPSGLKAINCLACAAPGCTPSIINYNSNSAVMHNGNQYNFQITVDIEPSGDSCSLTFNAQFPESNDQYLRWRDHRMAVRPICTNLY